MELTDDQKALFRALLTSVQLLDIHPTNIHSDRGTFGTIDVTGKELNLAWNQAFTEGDPIKHEENQLLIRPRYEFTVSLEGTVIFSHVSIFVILFGVQNQETVDTAFSSPEVKNVFYEKQIMKTMWPLLRQQVLDGMSRLGLPSIPLPWIVD